MEWSCKNASLGLQTWLFSCLEPFYDQTLLCTCRCRALLTTTYWFDDQKKKWLLTHTTTVGLLYTWMVIFSAFYQVFCRAFSHRAVFLGNTCLCLFCRQVLSFKCKLSFKYALSLPLIYTLCVKYNSHIFMAPFEEGRASCFAPVCLSVGWSTNSFIFFAEVAQTEIKFCKHF